MSEQNDPKAEHPPSDDNGTPNGATTAAWCPQCAAIVPPTGRGSCPACGGFLPGNVWAVKKPRISKKHLEEVNAQLIEEKQPQTAVQRSQCKALASVLCELEGQRPGSMEFQRLATLASSLSEQLDEARRAQQHVGPQRMLIRRIVIDPAAPAPSTSETSDSAPVAAADIAAALSEE